MQEKCPQNLLAKESLLGYLRSDGMQVIMRENQDIGSIDIFINPLDKVQYECPHLQTHFDMNARSLDFSVKTKLSDGSRYPYFETHRASEIMKNIIAYFNPNCIDLCCVKGIDNYNSYI